MKKDLFERVIFMITVVCAFFTPILDMLPWFRFTMLLAAITYLTMGWSLTRVRDNSGFLINSLVGLIYATVFFGNFAETGNMAPGKIIVYIGYTEAIALMVYMLYNKKAVRKTMVNQSVALFLIAPMPLFV